MIINDVQFNVELSDVLQELISQLRANGIPYIQKTKETATHIQVQCPYHGNGAERRPSAGLRKSDGIFHCFACNEVHSLPEVVSHCFGRDDDILGKFGWQWLLKNFATVQVEERKDVVLDYYRNTIGISSDFISDSIRDKSGYRQSDKRARQDEEVGKGYVGEAELDSYRYIHPYMYKRGLTDDIIEMFDIGFDASTETLTFPVKDIQGNVLFVARRSVVGKYFSYPAGSVKPLYGLYELYHVGAPVDEVIVCESMLDALSFWTIGKYAVALNGLGDDLQFKQLRELPCRKLILATDMDDRGLEARKRIRLNLRNTKILTEYMFPAGRKDANECTKDELLALEEVF